MGTVGASCAAMNRRIMLVDDQAFLTKSLRAYLERGGHTVLEENDPANALAAAMQFAPDLIVLDVIMPGLDGGKVAALLRAESTTCKVPILFLTSLLDARETRPGIVLGGYPYVAKTDVRTLADYIERFACGDDEFRAKSVFSCPARSADLDDPYAQKAREISRISNPK